MKNINSPINNIVPHTRIFQTLKVPERKRRLNNLQKNMSNFRDYLKIFEILSPKRKNDNKSPKKSNYSKNNISKSIKLKQNEEKKIQKFGSSGNFIPQKNSIHENLSKSSSKNDENNLYKNINSSLKRKNEELLLKMNKKNDSQKKEDLNMKLLSPIKNDIFVTEFNSKKLKTINHKNNSLRKVNTESNNYFQNEIIPKTKHKISTDNLIYKLNDILIKSESNRKILPPIKIKKKNILDIKYSPISKNKFENKSNNSIDSNISVSDIKVNSEASIDEDDDNIYSKVINNEKKQENVTIETSRIKSSKKNNISNLSNKISTLFGNDSTRKENSQEVKNLITDVNNLNKNVKRSRFYYELDNWIMRTRFKYAHWKYDIDEAQKYFINLKDYDKKEEIELDNRKSVYEKMESIIKELNDDKERKKYLDITKKYGIKLKNNKKKNLKDNEYWNNELIINKMNEINNSLKQTERRRIKERENRQILDELMFQCKKGVYNIVNS